MYISDSKLQAAQLFANSYEGCEDTSLLEDPGVPQPNGVEVQREMSRFRVLILPVKAKPSHKKQK